jgi:hypothetical protein
MAGTGRTRKDDLIAWLRAHMHWPLERDPTRGSACGGTLDFICPETPC